MKWSTLTFFLAANLFSQTAFPLIFDTLSYRKNLANGNMQTIILLGDCHEYLKEIEEHSRKTVSQVSKRQRCDIIALAKQLNATVLVEDIVYGVPTNPILGLPTMITLAMDRHLSCYHPQVITNFTPECKKNGLEAHSIECRHADSILETPPPYLKYVVSKLQKILMLTSNLLVPFHFFLSSFTTPLHLIAYRAIFQGICALLDSPSLSATLKELLAAYQYHENQQIITRAKALHKPKKIQQKIKAIEQVWQQHPSKGLDDLVDLKALNFIAEHPEKKVILICAGAWHIENVADFLEHYDYQLQPINQLPALKTPIKINAEMGPIQPVALKETFVGAHLSLA